MFNRWSMVIIYIMAYYGAFPSKKWTNRLIEWSKSLDSWNQTKVLKSIWVNLITTSLFSLSAILGYPGFIREVIPFLWPYFRYVSELLLVGGLEHDFYFPVQLGMSSSQLTNSNIFQRGRLNHQPDCNLPRSMVTLRDPPLQKKVSFLVPRIWLTKWAPAKNRCP